MTRPTLVSLVCLLAASSFSSPGAKSSTLLDPRPEPSSTRFGQALTLMGDLNGDGVPDFAVAAPFQDGDFVSTEAAFGKPQNVGKIYLIDGSSLAILGEFNDPEFQQIQLQHFGGQLGSSMACTPDLNGDGVPDLIAGVPHHIVDPNEDEELNNAGEAFVFNGKDRTVLFTLTDPDPEERDKTGSAVAALGDVDGDGVADVVVGVPGKDIGGEDGVLNVGVVHLFSGKTGQLIRTLNHPDNGGAEEGAAFGTTVANAGDLDGDGVSDVVIGAPNEGHVFVFSGKTGTQLFDIVSPVREKIHSFGSAIAAGTDFNRDGKPDIVVGSPLQEEARGAAYVFNGSNGTRQRTLLPAVRQPFAQFGAAVFISPDFNGDGRPDILVGAPGQTVNSFLQAGSVTAFDGKGRVIRTLTSEAPQSHALFGTSILTINLEGATKAIIGVPDESVQLDSDSGPVTHLGLGQIEVQSTEAK